MKEIKAFIQRDRVTDVVLALRKAAFHNMSIIDAAGILKSFDNALEKYSVGNDDEAVAEVKLELICHNENRTTEAVHIILEHGRTGQSEAGWIYINEFQAALPIGG